MRIGKSGAFMCDWCAAVIEGEADEVKQSEGTSHFCRDTECLAEYLEEKVFAARIQKLVDRRVKDEVRNITQDMVKVEVEKQVRQEIRVMDKITCASCTKRYKQKFVQYY